VLKPLQAGQLRHRVTIQVASEARNSHGEMIQTWAAIDRGTVWAMIERAGGTEQLVNSQTQAIATHKLTLRYRNLTITNEHRILFNSRVFNIVSVENIDERNVVYELMCQEVAA